MASSLKNRLVLVSLAIGIVVLLVLGSTVFPMAVRAYGNRLLTQGDVVAFASDILDEDEVLHFTSTIYWRVDQSMTEPQDPYHLSVLPFYRHKRTIEKWLTKEGFHEIERLADEQETVIGERILTQHSFRVYDAISSLAVDFPRGQTESQSPAPVQDASSVQVRSVRRTTESRWGRPAWIVEMKPQSADPSLFGQEGNALVAQQPYAEDLHFTQVQEFRTLDAKTRLTIDRQLFALAADGPVLLWEQQNSRPEILKRSELAFTWENFTIPEAQTLLEERQAMESAGQFTVPHTMLLSKTGVTQAELQTELEQVPISTLVFLNPRQVQERSGLDSVRLSVASHEWPRCVHQGLGFTLSLCGAPVDITYTSSSGSPEAQVSILQGPVSTLVPLLRQALPGWPTSQPIMLTVDGQEIQGWKMAWTQIVGLRSIMFEIQGTFVQMDFYSMPDETLSALLEHLEIKVERPVQRTQLYLPFLQR